MNTDKKDWTNLNIWLARLRDKSAKQGFGKLKCLLGMCCLGHASDVFAEHTDLGMFDITRDFKIAGKSGNYKTQPPFEVGEWLGIHEHKSFSKASSKHQSTWDVIAYPGDWPEDLKQKVGQSVVGPFMEKMTFGQPKMPVGCGILISKLNDEKLPLHIIADILEFTFKGEISEPV